MTPSQRAERIRALIHSMQNVEQEAMALNLHVTRRALNNATKAVGYELAGDIMQAGKYAPATDVLT